MNLDNPMNVTGYKSMLSSMISVFKALITYLWRQEAKKEKHKLDIASELEALADLFEEVLQATDGEGKINEGKISHLHRLRIRNWNRWTTILESSTYYKLPENYKKQIEDTLHVAHAAPGSYIKEIYEIQISLEDGYVEMKTLRHFSNSLDKLRNLAVNLRLN